MERKNLEHEERRLSESGASSQHLSEMSSGRKSTNQQMEYLAHPDSNEVEDLYQAACRVVKSDAKKAEWHKGWQKFSSGLMVFLAEEEA